MSAKRAKESLRFAVRLTPKGGRDAIEGWAEDAKGRAVLKARVAAAPEDGKANAALIALLAKRLGIAKSRIAIASGATARLKQVDVTGADDYLRERLAALGKSK